MLEVVLDCVKRMAMCSTHAAYACETCICCDLDKERCNG